MEVQWDEVTKRNALWSARRAVPNITSASSASKEVEVCMSRMLAGPEVKRSIVVQLRAGIALGAETLLRSIAQHRR